MVVHDLSRNYGHIGRGWFTVSTSTRNTRLPEIYMRVKDPKQIKKLMVIQDVSARKMAEEVGYKMKEP